MNIYQTLWQNDENRFSVSRKLNNNTFENPEADILLDEQIKADGSRDTDLAKYPLFNSVNQNKLKSEINLKFIKLLNNYIVNFRESENYTTEELDEINHFLELIKNSQVMQLAIDYIEHELNEPFLQNFNEIMFKIWFEIYTNWYNGRRTDYCSGFEHVFVGEGKYSGNTSTGNTALGEIDGYHNWIKFLLDEKTGRVNYLGYNYGLNNNEGPDNPNVVTLQMSWEHRDLNGDIVASLFKRKGGFFVGTSPECEIAMGTVAYFESMRGLFSNDDKKEIEIEQGRFNLVLYRNIDQNGTRGKSIRSFYPEYLGRLEFAEQFLKSKFLNEFKKSELINMSNFMHADFAYKNSAVVKRSIYSFDKDWKLTFNNWKK